MAEDVFNFITGCSNIRQLRLMLESGVSANCRNSRYETPMMVAISFLQDGGRRSAILKLLLQYGADVNLTNARGQTCFVYACILDQIDSLALLAEQKDLAVNRQDDKGNNGLMYACYLGNTQAVQVIVNIHLSGRHRFNFALTNNDGQTALQQAIAQRRAGVIACLSKMRQLETKRIYRENDVIATNRKSKQKRPSLTEGPSRSPLAEVVLSTSLISNSGLDVLESSVNTNTLHTNHELQKVESSSASQTPTEKEVPVVSKEIVPKKSILNKEIVPKKSILSKEIVPEKSEPFLLPELPDPPGGVEDLVKAVRQCAADIRQICKDYEIEFAQNDATTEIKIPTYKHAKTLNKSYKSLSADQDPNQNHVKNWNKSYKSLSAEEDPAKDLSLRARKTSNRQKRTPTQSLVQLVNSYSDSKRSERERLSSQFHGGKDTHASTGNILENSGCTESPRLLRRERKTKVGGSNVQTESDKMKSPALDENKNKNESRREMQQARDSSLQGKSVNRSSLKVPKVDCVDLSFGIPKKEKLFLPHKHHARGKHEQITNDIEEVRGMGENIKARRQKN